MYRVRRAAEPATTPRSTHTSRKAGRHCPAFLLPGFRVTILHQFKAKVFITLSRGCGMSRLRGPKALSGLADKLIGELERVQQQHPQDVFVARLAHDLGLQL